MTALCPCGSPLHYTDASLERYVDRMIKARGETVDITVPTKGTWAVPRHFIALHGLKASDLPELADRYGFRRVR